MTEGNLSALAPLIFFMAFMVAISIYVRQKQAKKNFVSANYDVTRYRLDLAHAIGDTMSVISQ